MFQDAKKAYAKRSKVVHGEYQGVRETEYEALVHEAENWLRRALVMILGNATYREIFRSPRGRDAFMERLVLGFDDANNEPDDGDG